MPICPAGHQTSQSDFCDTCGLPVSEQQPETTLDQSVEVAPPVLCPHCQTANVADALFCEACGYDFTSGTVPETEADTPEEPEPSDSADAAPESPTPTTAGQHPELESPPPPAGELDAPATHAAITSEPTSASPPDEPGTDEPSPAPPDEPRADEPSSPSLPEEPSASEASRRAPEPIRPNVEWVAELWIDPDWYAAQGSTDPLPSAGLPDIVPLVKENNLIGRVSRSLGTFPDVDCELDTGCSRRHAMLSTDGTRWWIEDLDSANGTFVGAPTGPLPAMPIPRGRVELASDQRIYVGAWTRIVVRRATEDEKQAFA